MPLRDDLLNPIPGDNPSGPNLRYDAQIDKMKEARREDLDIDQGEWKTALKTADHKLVIKLASEFLAKRSKDLQVAVWLIEAHVRQEGFALVPPSFRLVKDLLDQFWDTIYPEIEDGDLELRATPLEWLGSKLGFYLKELPLTRDRFSWHKFQESRLVGYEAAVAENDAKKEKRDKLIAEGKLEPEKFDESVAGTPLDFLDSIALELDESLAAIEELSQFCEEKFGDAAPSFRGTREAIEEIAGTLRNFIKGKERPSPEEAEEEEAPAEEEPSTRSRRFDDDIGVQIDASAGDESGEAEAPKPARRRKSTAVGLEPSDMEDAAERLAAVCRYLRAQNEVDPAPFMIVRGFRWGEVRQAAPPVRVAMLEAPPTAVRVNLKKMYVEEDWNAIIPACEEAMALPCGRGWLDLQRYSLAALEGRGFNEIVTGVKGMLRCLLEDLPELMDHTFTDDTPTCNAETRAWIESSILKKDEPAAAGGEASPEESSSTDDLSLTLDDSSSSSDDLSSLSLDTPVEATPEPEPLPEPPPPLDLAEMPPLLEETPLETPESTEPTDDGPKDIFDQAIAAVKAGSTKEGVALINQALATERSGRGRFKRRTQIAHLLVAAGQEKVAKPILTQLTREVEERKLEEWEDGEALAYSIELLLRCLVTDASEGERRTELYAKMCQLDPARALNHSYVNG